MAVCVSFAVEISNYMRINAGEMHPTLVLLAMFVRIDHFRISATSDMNLCELYLTRPLLLHISVTCKTRNRAKVSMAAGVSKRQCFRI
jgi:hypothetical protein